MLIIVWKIEDRGDSCQLVVWQMRPSASSALESAGITSSGYDSTITARVIAGTHNEAVALLKEYNPNFDPQHIVKSQRRGIEYIVAEKQA